MCRQNVLYGACLAALGLGVLIGTWLKSGLVSHILGVGILMLGVYVIRRR